MGTHTGRAYLNSCVKVPIDPCNNCPAPVYNRPKLCMGKQTKATSTGAKSLDEAPNWTGGQTGIRSLAKFYDSIPDYCEVKHLHKADFYSTLESLRTTSRELRAPIEQKERCGSATVSVSSSSCKAKQRNVKSKKLKKKTLSSSHVRADHVRADHVRLDHVRTDHGHSDHVRPNRVLPDQVRPHHVNPDHDRPDHLLTDHISPAPHSSSCLNDEYDKCLRDLSRLKSFKQDFALEVADFKRSLKGFELEFKRNAERPKSISSSGTQTHTTNAAITMTKMPAMHTAERAKCRRELLRRCFSVNDLSGSAIAAPVPTLSNYFPAKTAAVAGSELPQLHIECPSLSSSVASGSSRVRRRRARKTKVTAAEQTIKQPTTTTTRLLSIFELEPLPKRTTSVSPQHPVARPNLAATLRAEVARKKVKELQNNCTYHDPRPQFDWEVRKTPAWKSLSLNEPHKALLNIRLATRKAEQSLQERQYELHMQMMQERVKSAPLLLEGQTYWGPEVGKLSHTCRSEGMRHACESSQQRRSNKPHKKKCTSSRCTTAANDADAKMQQMRKIYAAQLKPSSSRQSQRSSSRRRQTAQMTPEPHDSGDDLCSVDRAFL